MGEVLAQFFLEGDGGDVRRLEVENGVGVYILFDSIDLYLRVIGKYKPLVVQLEEIFGWSKLCLRQRATSQVET